MMYKQVYFMCLLVITTIVMKELSIALSRLMQDEYGETALHAASVKGHVDVARYLVEKGAVVNSLNKVRQLDT